MTLGANGGALLVVDLPSRTQQNIALGTVASPAQPVAASAARFVDAPWGFALDAASGSVLGFDLSAVKVATAPDRKLLLTDFVPSAVSASASAVLAVSADLSSTSSAVLWSQASSIDRLQPFNGSSVPRCAASTSSGFFVAASGNGGAELLLIDDTGATLARQSAATLEPSLSSTTPLACAGRDDLAAVVFSNQLLIVSVANAAFGQHSITQLPSAVAASPHVTIAPNTIAIASGVSHDVWMVPPNGGSVHPLSLQQPGTAVAIATTPDAAALLVVYGAGDEISSVDSWFLNASEEIPVLQFEAAKAVTDIAAVAYP